MAAANDIMSIIMAANDNAATFSAFRTLLEQGFFTKDQCEEMAALAQAAAVEASMRDEHAEVERALWKES